MAIQTCSLGTAPLMRSPLTKRAGAPSRPNADGFLERFVDFGLVLFGEAGVEFG